MCVGGRGGGGGRIEREKEIRVVQSAKFAEFSLSDYFFYKSFRFFFTFLNITKFSDGQIMKREILQKGGGKEKRGRE